jgi:O-antigen/teichoic acid export membrane protein
MRLFKESFVYGLGYVFSRFQYFFILPFLLKKISSTDYGIIESLSVVQLFILVLVVNNFDTSISTFYYDENEKQKELEVTGLLSCILNSLVLLSIGFFFAKTISLYLLASSSYELEFTLAVLIAILNSIIHYNSFLLRMQQKVKQYSFLLVLQSLMALGLIYYFVIINYNGVRGYFLANLVASIVATIISFVMVHYSLKISSFKNNFLKLLKPAIPMIPVSVSAWSLTLVDRAILGKLSLGGMVDVGIYGFAVKMASLASVLWGPFQLAWMPFALSSFKEDGGTRVLEKASAWFFYSSYLIIILISLLSPIIISGFFPPEYLIAAKYVGPLVLCNFFYMAYYLPYTSLIQMKKLSPITLAFVSASLINVILNLWLIPKFGISGAVVSNLAGYLILLTMTYWYSRQVNYPNYFNRDQLFGVVFLVFVITGSSYIELQSFFLRILISSILCFLITFYFMKKELVEFKPLFEILKKKFRINSSSTER